MRILLKNYLLTCICALTACGDDKGTSESTGPGTGDATTGAASSSSGSSSTGVDPTTGMGPTSEPGSTSEPDPTTGGSTTTTGDSTTTTTATTATTGDATTDVPETGIVEGTPTIIEDRCAPDDGPAIEFKVGVVPFECGGDFPEDAPIVTVALWQGAPLAPGVYELDNGGGFASFDDGQEVKTSMTGTISVLEWGNAPIGVFDITFPDATKLDSAFMALYCPSEPPCK
jgi:hypothetical protein